jgi:SAM-dependent methyltransferase
LIDNHCELEAKFIEAISGRLFQQTTPKVTTKSNMQLIQTAHQSLIMNRRVTVLAAHLASLIPAGETLQGLDVGCGSGEIAVGVQQLRPQITLQGVDILVRSQTQIPVTQFDGMTLPFPDRHFDFVMLVDVLHHTENPENLLKECTRVSRQFILIKDHYRDSLWDEIRLKAMDWVGNRSYGVALPYNYLSSDRWQSVFQDCNLSNDKILTQLQLYSGLLHWIFDSKLHFTARLQQQSSTVA